MGKPVTKGKGKPGSAGFRKPSAGAGDESRERAKVSTSKREEAEIAALEKRLLEEEAIPEGSTETSKSEFTELPLSRYTLSGLSKHKYRVMTQIQRVAIPHALLGRDILGAAKTGSGKTLAFVVPVLEKLFRLRWTSTDGLGALIISPTRELALQIFEVVRTVGQAHFSLSAGVVTGGKDFAEEQESIGRMALLVATPGRLLQHLEQTSDFDVSGLRMLVLDEADRLLDMGFSDTLNNILSYLPAQPQRQTMLFSATQTKSVKDLARLSLNKPEYLAVHEASNAMTPSKLAQTYVVCKLQDKLNLLYSFIRSHLQQKTIVFVSSCKQSRFVFEAFRRLRPGVPLQLLHGKMKQARRMAVYYDFLSKPACVLFATDIAARGLDFPAVDWVVQLDCPEDVATYIHRVGRTARFRSKGHALAVLLPQEAPAMVPQLTAAKIPITEIHINPSAAVSITGKIAAEVAADADLKYLAQRAFLSYLRSVYLQPRKEVFDVHALPLQEFSESLGLALTPRVKFKKAAGVEGVAAERDESHRKKNENKALARLKAQIAAAKKRKAGSDDEASDSDDEDDTHDESDVSASDDGSSVSDSDSGSEEDSDDDSDEELLRPRKSRRALASEEEEEEEDSDEDAAVARGASSTAAHARAAGAAISAEVDAATLARMTPKERARLFAVIRDTKMLGQDGAVKGKDGLTPFQRIAAEKASELATAAAATAAAGRKSPKDLESAATTFATTVAKRLALTDTADRERERERVKTKHRLERLRAKGKLTEEDEEAMAGGGGAMLAAGGRDDDADSADGGEGMRLASGTDSDDSSEAVSESDSSSDDDSDDEAARVPPPSSKSRSMVVSAGAGASAAAASPAVGSKRKHAAETPSAALSAASAKKARKGAAGASSATAALPEEEVEDLAMQLLEQKRSRF